jgi:hypothetical protein
LRRLPRKDLTAKSLAAVVLAFPFLCCTGCGDRVYTDRSVGASKSYAVTVTGTSTSSNGTPLKHTATVTLIVLPAN